MERLTTFCMKCNQNKIELQLNSIQKLILIDLCTKAIHIKVFKAHQKQQKIVVAFIVNRKIIHTHKHSHSNGNVKENLFLLKQL